MLHIDRFYDSVKTTWLRLEKYSTYFEVLGNFHCVIPDIVWLSQDEDGGKACKSEEVYRI